MYSDQLDFSDPPDYKIEKMKAKLKNKLLPCIPIKPIKFMEKASEVLPEVAEIVSDIAETVIEQIEIHEPEIQIIHDLAGDPEVTEPDIDSAVPMAKSKPRSKHKTQVYKYSRNTLKLLNRLDSVVQDAEKWGMTRIPESFELVCQNNEEYHQLCLIRAKANKVTTKKILSCQKALKKLK